MSSNNKRIPPEEWRRHESTIKDLYYIRNHVVESKTGRLDLVNTMKESYDFVATAAQYQTQISKWESSKNLKKDQTRQIVAIIDRLKRTGIEARPVVSGMALGKARLQRMRRYLAKQPHVSGFNTTTQQLPPNIKIDVKDKWGVWVPFQDMPVGPDAGLSAPSPARASQQHSYRGPPTSGRVLESVATGLVDAPGGDFMLVPLAPAAPRNLEQSLRFDDGLQDGFIDSDFSACISPSIEALFGQWAQIELEGQDFEQVRARTHSINSPWPAVHLQSDLSPSRITVSFDFINAMLRKAADIQQNSPPCSKGNPLPHAEDVYDRLMSLVDEDTEHDNHEASSHLTADQTISRSPLYEAIVYSFSNGLAGLQGLPCGAILAILKEHGMSSWLIQAIQDRPGIAKPLIDNVFRAAVEACDAQVVKSIIRVVEGTANAIDPNGLACQFEGRNYTPLELAARFRNYEITSQLLKLGANVDMSRSESAHQSNGPLECAVQRWTLVAHAIHEKKDIRVAQALLDHNAKMTPEILRCIIKFPENVPVQQRALERLTAETHDKYFRMLPLFVQKLENALALPIVERLFTFCEATSCNKCVLLNAEVLHQALIEASLEGKLALCRFLLCHTRATNTALCAAFRSRDGDVISLLIEHGANPAANGFDGRRTFCPSGSEDQQALLNNRAISPWAESIRTQDNDLMQIPERAGVWSTMSNCKSFEAAVSAAAEVGDLDRLKRLLEGWSERGFRGHELYRALDLALNLALQHRQMQAAVLLLQSGAYISGVSQRLLKSHTFRALEDHDPDIIQKIIETDCDVSVDDFNLLELAIQQRNNSVIEDLIFMGADLDLGLITAVKAGDVSIVEKLLGHGADPSAWKKITMQTGKTSRISPLGEAARLDDPQPMTRLLLSHGADPANAEAFFYAIDCNSTSLAIMLEAFREKYPGGCPRFGSDVVIRAMETGNDKLFQSLVAAKMGVNSLSTEYKCTPLGFAIKHQRGQKEAWVHALLDAGADIHAVAAAPLGRGFYESEYSNVWPRETALVVAVKTRNTNMVRLLLQRGAKINEDARRGLKRTPLQAACESGSYDMVELLLQRAADVNGPAAYSGGGTALQLAAGTGSLKIVKLLLLWNADVHAPPSHLHGRSALEAAAEKGRLEVLKVLWEFSPFNFCAREIRRALKFAQDRGHRSCVDYLKVLFVVGCILLVSLQLKLRA